MKTLKNLFLLGCLIFLTDNSYSQSGRPTRKGSIIIGLKAHGNENGGCDPGGCICLRGSKEIKNYKLLENEATSDITVKKLKNDSFRLTFKLYNLNITNELKKEIFEKKLYLVSQDTKISSKFLKEFFDKANIKIDSDDIKIPKGTYPVISTGVQELRREIHIKWKNRKGIEREIVIVICLDADC